MKIWVILAAVMLLAAISVGAVLAQGNSNATTIGFVKQTSATTYTSTGGYNVTEGTNVQHVVVTIQREGGSYPADQAIDFTITTLGVPNGACQPSVEMAIPDKDYMTGAYTSSIPANNVRKSINIPIINDDIDEVQYEAFCVVLATNENNVVVETDSVQVSIRDEDQANITYLTDYIKLGEPGWNYFEGNLAIHVDKGISHTITLTCEASGIVAPFEIDLLASLHPQVSNHPVSALKDPDYLSTKGLLTCSRSSSKLDALMPDYGVGVDVMVFDSDLMPRQHLYDHDGDPDTAKRMEDINYIMVVGDMECVGLQQFPRIVINHPAPAGGYTFNLEESTNTINIPSSVTIPQGAHDIAIHAGVPSSATNATYDINVVQNGFHLPDGVSSAVGTLHVIPRQCTQSHYVHKAMPTPEPPPVDPELTISFADDSHGIQNRNEMHIVENVRETWVEINANLNYAPTSDIHLELKDRAHTTLNEDYSITMTGNFVLPKGQTTATGGFYLKPNCDDSYEVREYFYIRLENDTIKSNEIKIGIVDACNVDIPKTTPVSPAPTPTPTPDPASAVPNQVDGDSVGLYASSSYDNKANGEILVKWEAPGEGAPRVSSYWVYASKEGTDFKHGGSTQGTDHSYYELYKDTKPKYRWYAITGLEAGSYWVTITARNSNGESEPTRVGIIIQ